MPTEENLDSQNPVAPQQDNPQTVDADKAKRHSEQMEWARMEVERMKAEAERSQNIAYKTAISAAKVNGNSLLELYDEDPTLAEKVAKDWFGMTINEVKAFLNGEAPTEKVSLTQDDVDKLFEEKYEKRKSDEMHNESLQIAESYLLKIKDESLQEEARKKFQLLSEWKKLTPSLANELAEMATLYVNKDNLMNWAYTKSVETLSSTGLSSSKKSTKDTDNVWRIGLDWKFYPPSN